MKKHNIARAAVSAGLAIAMTLGSVAPATVALADTPANNITISNVDGNVTNFKGYQIFKADVVDNGTGKTVSNIAWAGDTTEAQTAVQNAVEGVIGKHDEHYAGTSAQDAADWIKENVTNTDSTTAVASDNIANELAKAVSTITSTVTVNGNTASSALTPGYWLFLTDPASVDNKVYDQDGKETGTKDTETYTAPIFTVIGGATVEVTEKSSIPTVDKFVKNDKTNSDWGKVADSEAGQELNYKLVGTVAQDVATYDTYYYKFTDKLSAGLTADATTIKVVILNNGNETDVTDQVTSKGATPDTTSSEDAKNQTSTLKVEFNDLKAAVKAAKTTLDSNSKVIVYYSAKLDPAKAYKVASQDNPNEVKLTYSNNPHSNDHGETVPHKVTDYTYKLNIVKESSKSADTKLAGARFTIQATGADEGTTTQYVQEDGSLGTDAHEFTTDEHGEIAVSGLDAGTYKVVETKSPDGYNKVADFTFIITPTWNNTDATKATALHSLAVEDNSTAVDSAVSDGQVNLTVKDTPGSGLPLTGQAGVTVTFVAGALVLAFGVSRVVRNRKEQDAE